jgi:hypothetical protein
MIDTLRLLASKDEQLEFQRRVPFVDVSVELFCRWDSEYIVDKEWFRSAYSAIELKAMADFQQIIEEAYKSFENLPPIQEFVLTAEWDKLTNAAAATLLCFESEVETEWPETIETI